jgi:hypothetical protein
MVIQSSPHNSQTMLLPHSPMRSLNMIGRMFAFALAMPAFQVDVLLVSRLLMTTQVDNLKDINNNQNPVCVSVVFIFNTGQLD